MHFPSLPLCFFAPTLIVRHQLSGWVLIRRKVLPTIKRCSKFGSKTYSKTIIQKGESNIEATTGSCNLKSSASRNRNNAEEGQTEKGSKFRGEERRKVRGEEKEIGAQRFSSTKSQAQKAAVAKVSQRWARLEHGSFQLAIACAVGCRADERRRTQGRPADVS